MTIHSLLLFIMVVASSESLQLLKVSTNTGNARYEKRFGVDFTVYTPIAVSAVGAMDADAAGFQGSPSVSIVDRSTDSVIHGPYNFTGMMRANASNPFAFQNVTFQLQIGVYTLVSQGFDPDQYIDSANQVVEVNSIAVSIGDDVWADVRTAEDEIDHISTNPLVTYGSATFVFEVVNTTVTALPERMFSDCEQVVCAGHGAGEFNIQGQRRYCDADGSMRLWRISDSTCERNGWTSTRNPTAGGPLMPDPFGCRPKSAACNFVSSAPAPFSFRQVRAANWSMWLFKTPGAFANNGVGRLYDGVTVRDNSNNTVFVFAGAGAQASASRCPCDSNAATTTSQQLSGAAWACGPKVLPTNSSIWQLTLADNSSQACTSSNVWTTLGNGQRSLSIALCLDNTPLEEDMKLASGDLFVRKTVDFNVARDCPSTTTSSSTTSTTNITTTRTTTPSRTTTTTATKTTTTTRTTSTSMSTSTSTSTSTTEPSATDNPTNATTTNSSTTTAAISVDNSNSDSSWIVPTIVAAVAGAMLLAVTAGLIYTLILLKRSRSQSHGGEMSSARSMHGSSGPYESSFRALS
jgi:hypothetical protein